MKRVSRKAKKNVRHKRVRRHISGSSSKPRLSVFRSARHAYAQIVDDASMTTLLSASTLTPKVKELLAKDDGTKTDAARVLGKYIGELSLLIGVKEVAFDRGGYKFHGRIKALAEGAREAGLIF